MCMTCLLTWRKHGENINIHFDKLNCKRILVHENKLSDCIFDCNKYFYYSTCRATHATSDKKQKLTTVRVSHRHEKLTGTLLIKLGLHYCTVMLQ